MIDTETGTIESANDALSLLTATPGSEGDAVRGISREGVLSDLHAQMAAGAQTANDIQKAIASGTETNTTNAAGTSSVTSAGALSNALSGAASSGNTTQPQNTTAGTAAGGTSNDAGQQATVDYDPTQTLRLKDGTVTTVASLEHAATHLKPRYDQMVSELKKKEDAIESKSRAVDANYDYLNAISNNGFAAVFATAKKNGASDEAALKAGLEATGMGHLLAGQAPKVEEGPPQPGTERYYLTDFKELGIDPMSPDYDKWFAGNVETRVRVAAREENAKVQSTLSAQLNELMSRLPAQETPEQQRERQVRSEFLHGNTEMLRTIPNAVLLEHKIDGSALTPIEQRALESAIEKTFEGFGLQINDKEWMEKNVLTKNDVLYAVSKTPVAQILQSQRGGTTAQRTPPRVDTLDVRTIAALPASDGAVPAGIAPYQRGDEDSRYMEDALSLLRAA